MIKKIILSVIVLIIFLPIVWFSWLVFRMNNPNIGINAESFSRIPNSAHEIYFIDAPLYGQCIFTIGNIEFNNWIDEKKYSIYKINNPNSSRSISSKIKGYPMEIMDCKNAIFYEWRDVDGGGFSVNYFKENGLVVYDWSSN